MVLEMKPAEKPNWTAVVNGEPMVVHHLTLSNPKFGTLEYGMRPEKYDGWVFHENGGGGSVTLPYVVHPDGYLLVGLLPEERANMGPGKSLCIIGGYVDPGQNHDQAQRAEADEEAGLGEVSARPAKGLPVSNQRTHWDANRVAGEGVHIYFVELPYCWLNRVSGFYSLGAAKLADAAKMKKGMEVRFMRVNQAVFTTADDLALSAIARLVAELYGDMI